MFQSYYWGDDIINIFIIVDEKFTRKILLPINVNICHMANAVIKTYLNNNVALNLTLFMQYQKENHFLDIEVQIESYKNKIFSPEFETYLPEVNNYLLLI